MASLIGSLLSRLTGRHRWPVSSGTLQPEQSTVNSNGSGAVEDGETGPSSPLSEGEPRIMNFKELIDTISQETSIPAGQVKKVGTSMLEKFSELIEKQENFRSPIVNLNSSTIPAKEASGNQPAQPEKKIARMIVATTKVES